MGKNRQPTLQFGENPHFGTLFSKYGKNSKKEK